MYLLGYDIGSSSVKVALLEADSGTVIASATSPKTELPIIAERPGWAEQHPDTWWEHAVKATAEIAANTPDSVDLADVKAIGISYQMHGLVIVDKDGKPLRPAIIWCDSRAVEIGEEAFAAIGSETCLSHMLNSPGNFTASKLRWVQQNEPDVFARTHRFMLPGDYIAYRLTGEMKTSISGLSEGILWDYKQQCLANLLLDHYDIPTELACEAAGSFCPQGGVTSAAAAQLGLKAGTPVAYRGGDQPNNALSLNVLNPGEIAATAGTSGVVYGITDQANYDPQSRVNTFVHVNHTTDAPRYGVLLCINGTGILNSWLKHNTLSAADDYPQMNDIAAKAPIGSDGLVVLPFGNGAERPLNNADIGASVHNLNFNTHDRSHLLRAAQEGIVFALNYGCDIMRSLGVDVSTVRAGRANMFLSPLFATAFATVTGACVQLYNTDGSQGAARGAGLGAGIYKSPTDAFVGLKTISTIEPDDKLKTAYQDAYQNWITVLREQLNNSS